MVIRYFDIIYTACTILAEKMRRIKEEQWNITSSELMS